MNEPDSSMLGIVPVESVTKDQILIDSTGVQPIESVSSHANLDTCFLGLEPDMIHDLQLDSVVYTSGPDKIVHPSSFGSPDVYQIAAKLNSSPLRPHVFEAWLQGYDEVEKKQLLSDLTVGVRIPSALPPIYHVTIVRYTMRL